MDQENNNNPTSNPAAAAAPNVTNLFDPETATAGEPASAAAPDLASAAAELTNSLQTGAPLDTPAPTAPATDPLVSAANPSPAATTAKQPASVFGAPATTASAFGTPATPAASAEPAPAPETPAPEAPAEEPADDEPLKPAAPVPGSLGSVQSYSDIEAAEAEAAAKAAAPKKKLEFNKTTIIMLAILGVVVVGAIIVAVVMINGGKKTNKNSNGGGNANQTPVAPVVINTKNLICSREASAEEITQLSAVAADTSVTVEYEDDEMTSFSEVTNATYADHLSAEGGKSIIMESYTAALTLNGLASDPFDSTYVIVDTNGNDGSTPGGVTETPDELVEGEGANVNPLQSVDNPEGTIVRATHSATPTTLDISSAVMFGLSTDADGNVDTALSSVEKVYAARGYTCQAQ